MLTYNEIQNTQSSLSEIIRDVDSAGGQLISGEISEAVKNLQSAQNEIDNIIGELQCH